MTARKRNGKTTARERCPCCGQVLPRRELPPGVRLTVIEGRIFDAVISWPNMSSRELMHWSYGYKPEFGLLDDNTIRVHVNNINRKLRPHGKEITAADGRGYVLKGTKRRPPKASGNDYLRQVRGPPAL